MTRRGHRWVLITAAAVLFVVVLSAVVTNGARETSPSAPEEATGEGAPELTVDGNLLRYPAGDRFLLRGVTAYLMPFYATDGRPDEGLRWTAGRNFENRAEIFESMRDHGINTVRVPLAREAYDTDFYDLGGRDGYLARLADIVDAAAEEDLFVIFTWFDSLGMAETFPDRYREVFPMMREVREHLGEADNVLYEPFNEPHEVSWDDWEPAMIDTVTFWREELSYEGVLFLDTIEWSWSFDPEPADALLEADEALLGSPNVVFANHRYANQSQCFCDDELAAWEEEVGQHVSDYPIAGTEYGYYNHEGPPVPRWNTELFRHLRAKEADGFNGTAAFVWDWNDWNDMTEGDMVTLNAHGRIFADEVLRP